MTINISRMRQIIGFISILFFAVLGFSDHIEGIRATVTNESPGTNSATVDVTVYASTGSDAGQNDRDNGPADGPFTYIGSSFYGIPAIDWGDGSTTPQTTIPLVASGTPATFRGSFSHTFPNTDPRTVSVFSNCCAGSGALVTGAPYSSYGGYVYVIFNTASVFGSAQIPTLSTYGLAIFSLLMVVGGVFFMRRRTA